MRIDRPAPMAFHPTRGPARPLSLAFDPTFWMAETIPAGDDPRDRVRAFGRRRLRRAVATVALGEAGPSLVQPRLLAPAA